MICPNCQKEIPDAARACGYCGHWLAGEQKLPDKVSQEEAVKKAVPWLWIGLGVVALILVGGTAYMLGGGGGNVNTEATVAAALTASKQEEGSAVQSTKTLPERSKPETTPQPAANTPVPVLTNTPKPTNTPRPTPTPTATIDADPAVYDNFNNSANEGSYNKGRWDVYNPLGTCKVAQSEGILTVSAITSQIEEGCILNGPRDILGNRLNLFEAKMKTSDSKGDVAITQLVLTSDGFSGGGWASCGLWAYPGGINAFFSITKQGGQTEEFHKENSTQSSSWHTMRYEIDPNDMTFSCFVDDKLVGSTIPADAEKLKAAVISRYIQIYLSSNSSVTALIDDVRVVP